MNSAVSHPPRYEARYDPAISQFGIWDTFGQRFVEFETFDSAQIANCAVSRLNRAYAIARTC